MDENMINTIEMTRQIRDEHARLLAGVSHAERIAFFRERAKKLQLAEPSHETQDDITLQRIREKRAIYKKK